MGGFVQRPVEGIDGQNKRHTKEEDLLGRKSSLTYCAVRKKWRRVVYKKGK
jgi:hypothetical protein